MEATRTLSEAVQNFTIFFLFFACFSFFFFLPEKNLFN